MFDTYETIEAPVVVVGGGGAAMRAAIEATERGSRVLLLSKGPVAQSGATPAACPSYQAAVAMEDPQDSPQQAFYDTCVEGRHLGDENLIWAMTTEATERAQDMAAWRLKYEMNGDKWLQVQHPGHSFARNLVIRGCGYAMAASLRTHLRSFQEQIQTMEDAMLLQVFRSDSGEVAGCLVLDMAHNRFVVVKTHALVLATGGYQQLWRFTDTGPDLTGDGVWAAYHAGAALTDMEMSLYYPSCLKWPPELEGTLVQYEGLVNPAYGGAPLLNGRGEPIIEAGLPPVRDELMKIMVTEILEGRGTEHGGVFIDTPHAVRPAAEFMEVIKRLDSLPYNQLRDFGIDVTKTPLEVAPGVHFTLGGVQINEWTETTIPGLFAAGEVAGNVHGANRTSGNALAESQVFGKRGGERAAEYARTKTKFAEIAHQEVRQATARWVKSVDAPASSVRPREIKSRIKNIMDTYMGYQRNEEGMKTGLAAIRSLQDNELQNLSIRDKGVMSYEWREAIEVDMMLELATVIISSGLYRKESRGHHWRSDYPESNDRDWLKHTMVVRGEGRSFTIGERAVVRLAEPVLPR